MCIVNRNVPRRDKFIESRLIIEKLSQKMSQFTGNNDL
jgi:hypothetical protein